MTKKVFLMLAATLFAATPIIAEAQGAQGQRQGQGAAAQGQRQGQGQAGQFQRMTPEERQKQRRDQLVKDLKLNADQTKKLDAILKAQNDERQKLFGQMGRPGGQAGAAQGGARTGGQAGNAQGGNRAGGAGNAQSGAARTGGQAGAADRQQMMQQMQAHRDKYNKQIRAILTPAQQKTFDEMIKREDEQMRQRMQAFGQGQAQGGQRGGATGGGQQRGAGTGGARGG
ncbi:MAG: hypothetical protein ACK4XJ_07210 [Fimbriimonadaceae bacterium]